MDRADALLMSVEHVADDVVVWVAGELTATTGPRLLRTLDTVFARRRAREGAGSVVVDLGGVLHFDLEGIAALRHAHHAAASAGIRMVVAGLDGHEDALPRRIAAALSALGTGGRAPAVSCKVGVGSGLNP